MSTKKKLPDKLSALIRVAVEDAKKIEKNPKYIFNMGTWHNPESNYSNLEYRFLPTGKCEVCLAGSVMACTLKTNINETKDPEEYDDLTRDKLFVIDNVRSGYIKAINSDPDDDGIPFYLGKVVSTYNKAIIKANGVIQNKYNSDLGRAPWRTYLQAANILEKAGL